MDRDDRSDHGISDRNVQDIRVLARRHLESYLFDGDFSKRCACQIGRVMEIAGVLQGK
jgi:hypothetical protein